MTQTPTNLAPNLQSPLAGGAESPQVQVASPAIFDTPTLLPPFDTLGIEQRPLVGDASTRPTRAASPAIFETAAPAPKLLTLEWLAARVAELAGRIQALEGPAASVASPGTPPDEAEIKRRLSAVASLASATRNHRILCRFCGHSLAHHKSLRQHLQREHRADLIALPWNFGT